MDMLNDFSAFLKFFGRPSTVLGELCLELLRSLEEHEVNGFKMSIKKRIYIQICIEILYIIIDITTIRRIYRPPIPPRWPLLAQDKWCACVLSTRLGSTSELVIDNFNVLLQVVSLGIFWLSAVVPRGL